MGAHNKGDSSSSVENGQGESNPLRGRLGGIDNRGYPEGALLEERMGGEEGGSVAIGTHSEEDQVEGREGRGWGKREGADGLLVVLGSFHGRKGGVHEVNVLLGDGDVIEEALPMGTR